MTVRQSRSYEDGETPAYAFCESVTGLSKWHIRKVTPNVGLRLGGGIDTTCCCGHVRRGWDLRVRLTAQNVVGDHVSQPCVAAAKSNGMVLP
jgi:hypothetical protein